MQPRGYAHVPYRPAPRPPLVAVAGLVAAGACVAAAAALAAFVRYQALDRDGFRATAADLIADREVRDRVAIELVRGVFAAVDVEAELRARLPETPPEGVEALAARLRAVAEAQAPAVLEEPEAQGLLLESFAGAHDQVVRLVHGDEGAVAATGGFVVLELAALAARLGAREPELAPVLAALPEGALRVPLMHAGDVEPAQDAARALDAAAVWLALLALGLFAAAVALARGRRFAALGAVGAGLAAAGVLVLAARSLGGRYVVDGLVLEEEARPAAENAWAIVAAPLGDDAWALLATGALLVVAAAVAARARRPPPRPVARF